MGVAVFRAQMRRSKVRRLSVRAWNTWLDGAPCDELLQALERLGLTAIQRAQARLCSRLELLALCAIPIFWRESAETNAAIMLRRLRLDATPSGWDVQRNAPMLSLSAVTWCRFAGHRDVLRFARLGIGLRIERLAAGTYACWLVAPPLYPRTLAAATRRACRALGKR